jgi:hypothetical protein
MEVAFRIEKTTSAVVTGILALASGSFGQRLQCEARYVHGIGGQSKTPGILTVMDSGIAFTQTYKDGKEPKHPYAFQWAYHDIQQLRIAPNSLSVLTYKDNKWKLGADREYEFDIDSNRTFEDAYGMLKTRLDQRFVVVMAAAPETVLWQIPVKHLVAFGGDDGVLEVGPDQIVYKSADPSRTRTWRYEDIDNISSSGPFQLTITTFERTRLDYGSRKQFNFELKQGLDQARYNELWLKLEERKGLGVLNGYRQ